MNREDLRTKLAGSPSKWPDFLVIGAFRYALGRQTYVVSETLAWLIANWQAISIKARSVISRDLDTAIASDNAERAESGKGRTLGADMDRTEWIKLAAKIEAYKPVDARRDSR